MVTRWLYTSLLRVLHPLFIVPHRVLTLIPCLCLCIVFCFFVTQGSVDNVTRLFDIPDRQGKLSNRIDGFNAKGEKLELCADSASDKERWVDAIESHPGVESVSMDEHPSRGERGWFG